MIKKFIKKRKERKKDICKVKMQTFDDFVKYLKSPTRVFWSNFYAGIFRGLGFIVGVTFVFAIIVWFLSKMINFPIIGEYFAQAEEELSYFAEKSDYNKEFERIELLMTNMDQNLEKLVQENAELKTELLEK